MKSRIPEQNHGMNELEKLWSAKLKEASLNGFMLGGHSAMKLAADRFGEDIRKATTFEELQPLAFALLDYLEDKAEGLKNAAEGRSNG